GVALRPKAIGCGVLVARTKGRAQPRPDAPADPGSVVHRCPERRRYRAGSGDRTERPAEQARVHYTLLTIAQSTRGITPLQHFQARAELVGLHSAPPKGCESWCLGINPQDQLVYCDSPLWCDS